MVCSDCKGLCCLDQKRIAELRQIDAQKEQVRKSHKQVSILQDNRKSHAVVDTGMLALPPMVPENCTLANDGEIPAWDLDVRRLHPHMASILGVDLDQNVVDVLTSVAHNPSLERKLARMEEKKPIQCPRCEGMGFTHDSSAKHDKKKGEKCKKCSVCKGVMDLLSVCRDWESYWQEIVYGM
jgi:hypothetical protein